MWSALRKNLREAWLGPVGSRFYGPEQRRMSVPAGPRTGRPQRAAILTTKSRVC
jgi:hypothetical protein